MEEQKSSELGQDSIDKIKRKSVSGVAITGIIQGVSMLGGFLLSIILSPSSFGVFTLVVATASFLSYFSDIGLGAALIQKSKKVTRDDLTTTFTIQQGLVIVICVIALSLSGWIGSIRGFDAGALLLFRILILSFFISSLKTIPSILLERDLEFGKLAKVQIVEVVVFNVVVVLMALQGSGILMFGFAVLAKSVIGLMVLYVIRPWMPALGIVSSSAKKLISYGIPFQVNSLLALLKDQLFVMILPFFVPISAVGYIGWAKKWSEVPLRLIMDNVIRVTFPTYSRLQADPEKLSKGITKTIFILMLCIIPISIGMLFIINPLIHIIPKYIKWEPALTSFYLFTIASAVAGISSPLLNALNAIGKIKISLYFMVFWTGFVWVVTPIFVYFIGFNGVAATAALMSVSTIAVVYISKKYIAFSLGKEIVPSLISAIIMGLALLLASQFVSDSLISITFLIILGVIVYLGNYVLFFRKKLFSEISYLTNIYR